MVFVSHVGVLGFGNRSNQTLLEVVSGFENQDAAKAGSPFQILDEEQFEEQYSMIASPKPVTKEKLWGYLDQTGGTLKADRSLELLRVRKAMQELHFAVSVKLIYIFTQEYLKSRYDYQKLIDFNQDSISLYSM